MRVLAATAALALLATAVPAAVADKPDAPENYAILFGEDFDERVAEKTRQGTNVLVFFMAPWCGNCKSFAPEFLSAAQQVLELQNEGSVSKTMFAEIDADEYSEVADKFDVNAFPTLKWIPAGAGAAEAEGFDAAMDSDGVVRFVKSKAGSPVTALPDAAALTGFIALRSKVMFRDALVLLLSRDAAAADDINKQLVRASLRDSHGMRFASYASATPAADLKRALGSGVSGADADFGDDAVVVIFAEPNGLRASSLTQLRASGDALEALLKSAEQLASPVVELTSTDFQRTLDGNAHVLVEFYAPWCGYCQKLAPVYEALAALAASKQLDLVVAKVDATQEEALAERFGVEAFPTLKWFRNGAAHEFSKERQDARAMLAWAESKMGPVFAETLGSAAAARTFLAKSAPASSGSDGAAASDEARPRTVVLLVDSADAVPAALEEAAYGLDALVALGAGLPADDLAALGVAGALPAFLVAAADGSAAVVGGDAVDMTDAKAVRAKVALAATAVLVPFSDDFLDDAIDNGASTIVFAICPKGHAALGTLKQLAEALGDPKTLFSHVDSDDAELDYALEFFLAPDMPASKGKLYLRVVRVKDIDESGDVYAFGDGDVEKGAEVDPASVTVAALREFLEDFDAGKLKPMPDPEAGDYDDDEEEDGKDEGYDEKDEL